MTAVDGLCCSALCFQCVYVYQTSSVSFHAACWIDNVLMSSSLFTCSAWSITGLLIVRIRQLRSVIGYSRLTPVHECPWLQSTHPCWQVSLATVDSLLLTNVFGYSQLTPIHKCPCNNCLTPVDKCPCLQSIHSNYQVTLASVIGHQRLNPVFGYNRITSVDKWSVLCYIQSVPSFAAVILDDWWCSDIWLRNKRVTEWNGIHWFYSL